MAAISRYGVCYDLDSSPYRVERGGFVWMFSTARHAEKFRDGAEAHEDWINDSLTRRFKVEVKADQWADLHLYMQLEGRGFMVVDAETGEVFTCPEEIQGSGRLRGRPNSRPR